MPERKTMPEMERRSFPGVEVRAEAADGEDMPAIVGRAAVFDALSEEMWGFRERIEKGAFAATIAEDDIRALVNHSPDYVLGRNRSSTLSLAEDDDGLSVRIEPPDTRYARDLVTSIERSDVSGMSIGFQTLTDEWNVEDGDPVRTLKAVRLFDVSVVTFPAYPQTDVALRSLMAFRGRSMRSVRRELDLMEAGYGVKRTTT